jgi:hypothetical protein
VRAHFAALGAEVAGAPAELGACELVEVCAVDDHQVDEVLMSDGIIQAMAGIAVHVPVVQPPSGRDLDLDTRTRNVLQRFLRCFGWLAAWSADVATASAGLYGSAAGACTRDAVERRRDARSRPRRHRLHVGSTTPLCIGRGQGLAAIFERTAR